ncbi:MAG: lysophospholipid acyltransferase family protein [Myxococcales bacterium]
MSPVRAILRTGAFMGWSATILGAFEIRLALTPQAERDALADRYRARLSRGALRLFGTELLVQGQPSSQRGALVVANHQSALDIGVMLALFQAVLVSRHDVAQWPLLGRLAKHGDTIFVDRDNRRSGAAALREIRRRVEEGRTVAAFPEGGTFPGDSVHPFHAGVFAAVQPLDAPVIPVGLAYSPAVPYGQESFARHMARIAARPTTRIAVHLGEPLDRGSDAKSTAQKARARVESLVLEARAALEALGS